MAILNIIRYKAGWDLDDKVGKLKLQTNSGEWSHLKIIERSEDFSVIMDLLRNEQPIFYDTENNILLTNPELI
jgi:hypothetical protein